MASAENDFLRLLCNTTLTSIVRIAGVRLFPAGYVYGPHSHRELEVICVESGVCIIKFHDECKEEYINKGETIIIYPNTKHTFIIADDCKCRVTQLQITLAEFDSDEEIPDSFKFIGNIKAGIPFDKIDKSTEIKNCIYRIKQNMSSEKLLMIYLVELFVLLSNELNECKKEEPDVKDEKLQSIIEYIEHNISEEIIIEDMCELFDISSRYLRKKFHDTLGCNINHYIATMRLNRAKQLLSDRSLSIIQVAHQSGFSSSQYFSRVFRKIVGKTPSKYRIQHYRSQGRF